MPVLLTRHWKLAVLRRCHSSPLARSRHRRRRNVSLDCRLVSSHRTQRSSLEITSAFESNGMTMAFPAGGLSSVSMGAG